MSSDGTTDQASVGRLSAFDGRLSKPLRQSELYDTLASILGISSVASIPSPTSTDDAHGHLDSPPHQGRRTRVNVLVAEDHPVNQKLVAWILEEAGHRVAIVGDGRQAVDALEAGRFDVVLMDVQMPVMDGFEAVARIRALPDSSRARIPIIALTAHAMKGDRERCLTAGFDGYLSKPIRAEILLSAIDELFPATQVPCKSGKQLIDGLAEKLGGNEDFAREIVATFLKSAALSRSAIASALQSGDMARLAFEAHGLKGACLTIGADDLAELCRRLEHAGVRNEIDVTREATSAVLGELAGVSVTLEEYLGTHT
jgi:two-component system sensor histidine kinase/response regulator